VAGIQNWKLGQMKTSAKDAPKENGVLRWVLPKNLPASIVVLGDMGKTARVPMLKRRANDVTEGPIWKKLGPTAVKVV
jgi:hypothetical protein